MNERKPAHERKSEIISLRITAEEKDALEELARTARMKVPNLIRHLLGREFHKSGA